jgi:hypothetical protein
MKSRFRSQEPIDELTNQCRATVERRAPTYFQHVPSKQPQTAGEIGHSRLILPLWGGTRVEMLLGAVVDTN